MWAQRQCDSVDANTVNDVEHMIFNYVAYVKWQKHQFLFTCFGKFCIQILLDLAGAGVGDLSIFDRSLRVHRRHNIYN